MNNDLTLEINDNDHIEGTYNGENSIIVYMDYSLEDSRSLFTILQRIIEEVGDTTTIAIRSANLTENLNPLYAVEAAGEQDMFFEYVDILLNQKDKTDFGEIALKLEMDLEKFRKSFSSDYIKEKIVNNTNEAKSLGIENDSLFINGTLYEGLYEKDSILKAINKRIDPDSRINTAENKYMDYDRDDPDAYDLDPMPTRDVGYSSEGDEDGTLYTELDPDITLDEYEQSTNGQDHSDPEPS